MRVHLLYYKVKAEIIIFRRERFKLKRRNVIMKLTAAVLALTLVSGGAVSGAVFAAGNETEIITDDGYALYGSYKYYYNSDNTVCIHSYTGTATEITLPKAINNKTVTSMDAGALSNLTALKKVTVPDSFKSISREAFKGCTALTAVNIGSGVASIGADAFKNCISMKEITIPKTVTSIDDGAGIGIASGSPISGFIVYGYDGTAAQSYAEKKGLTFVSLNTPLKNTSSISKTNAKPYETVTLYGSAEGGSEEYTYAFLYKPTSSSSWKVKGTKFGTASTATLTLGTAGTYDILISVKDSSGKTEAKRFTLTIEKTAEFVNTSTISATNVNTGKKITLTGSAKGGAAPYTYTYQYMKPDKTKWTTLGDKYGTAGSVTFNTKIPGTYKARVLAKNSNGTVKISSFTVTAKGTLLENKSTISSTSVKKGSTVTLRGAYSGGTAPYYFTYQYKMPGSTKWNVIGKYNITSQTASCTVNVTGTYEMRVLIKDSTDYVASKTFKVTVS